MARVFLTRALGASAGAALAELFELDLHDSDWPPARDELLRRVRGVDGLLTMVTDRVDAELLDAAGPSLRVVANHGVGYDNIDLPEATRRGVVVANTPDVLSTATAELTMALVLDLLRRVSEGDRFLRRREPWIWSPRWMVATGLAGRTLGIVGPGRIGQEVARLAEAFGMRVVVTSRSRRADVAYPQLELGELLAGADVVSLHCPLTPETHHLIDRDALARMRRDAFLVNTTRGPVVDEPALVAALRAGEIGGAALDVFEREPEVHEGLLELENVVLSPHLGSGTGETREAMAGLCVDALRAVLLERRLPSNALNPEGWE